MVVRRVVLVIGIFVVCILVQLWLEKTNRADSVGWWYTIYCAAIYSAGILVVLLLLRLGWRASRCWSVRLLCGRHS